MTVIALDAMGGDFVPRAPVEAAVRAVRELSCQVILVGDAQVLEPELQRHSHDPEKIHIHHTAEHLSGEDSPAEGLRRKKQASVRVAFDLVKIGQAQAALGAGHSGGLMIAGKMALGTLPGIDRPAIASHLPHSRGTTILLDSGANVDCKPHYLINFAVMGAIYAQLMLNNPSPRVALLSNGREAGKGNDLTRQVYRLLEQSALTFAGNLEPRDLFKGKAEVIVCDGFVGNLVLKTAEAAGTEVRLLLRDTMTRSPLARLGRLLLRRFFLDLARRTDHREIGGSLLLGLRGVGIVCHGSSSPRAIANGIRLAMQCVEQGLVEEIDRGFRKFSTLKSASA
ncbi:MAG: phosphate acyltransferase PlsX [SAR324 cluster bacterium]|nr:phosphate acyltransferase PlsX [SAR324 cluster bacterium]